MKRNQQTQRVEHQKRNGSRSRSRYAEKLSSGRMMYGPGCCAHTTRVKGGFYASNQTPDV